MHDFRFMIHWIDQIYRLDANKSRFCRKRKDICGLVRITQENLIVEWEGEDAETYVVDQKNNRFVLSNQEKPSVE